MAATANTSPPILALEAGKKEAGAVPTMTPNLLPCRVHHNGPVDIPASHWAPTQSAGDHQKTAYFRGRKLAGVTLPLPTDYTGAIVHMPEPESDGLDGKEDGGDGKPGPANIQVLAKFHEIVVWGQDQAPDESTDPYIRDLREWVHAAHQMHAIPAPPGASDPEKDKM